MDYRLPTSYYKLMYFHNRAQAGRLLASKLLHYQNQSCVVLALSPGALIIGAQVAMRLHANLLLLMTEDIVLPGENDALAAMSSVGTFTYNNIFSAGEIEELASEYQNYISQQRMEKLHELNRLVGKDGEIRKEYLRHHTIIVVSDGFANGFSLEIAAEYLKTVAIKKLVVATPLASVPAVDRMHLLSDEICCLSVVHNYMNTNHYYDDNTIPDVHDMFKIVKTIALHWERPTTVAPASTAVPATPKAT